MPDAITAISLVALGTSLPRARKQKDSFETFEGEGQLSVSKLERMSQSQARHLCLQDRSGAGRDVGPKS